MRVPRPLRTAFWAAVMWAGWSVFMLPGASCFGGAPIDWRQELVKTAVTTAAAALGGAIYGMLRLLARDRVPAFWFFGGGLAGALVAVPVPFLYAARGPRPGELSVPTLAVLAVVVTALIGAQMAGLAEWAMRARRARGAV